MEMVVTFDAPLTKIRMKRRLQLSLALLAWPSLASPSRAAVLVDDTWADGKPCGAEFRQRNRPGLPPGCQHDGESRQPERCEPGHQLQSMDHLFHGGRQPSQLNVGDTLTVTIAFTPSQCGAELVPKLAHCPAILRRESVWLATGVPMRPITPATRFSAISARRGAAIMDRPQETRQPLRTAVC